LVYQVRQCCHNSVRHGIAHVWHHTLEQFYANDRGLWLDLCRLSLERAGPDVELCATVLYYYPSTGVHIFFKMKRILIMGLPGAGKTTLAKQLAEKLNAQWFNADEIRAKYNDWDFSEEGRIRQSQRMRTLADTSTRPYVIADFIAPLTQMRDIYAADYVIWMDTICEGRFEDTNRVFEPPKMYDLRITNFDYSVDDILKELS
jgi:adenylylsulfate kinase